MSGKVLLWLALLFVSPLSYGERPETAHVLVVPITGVIGPASAELLSQSIARSIEVDADLLIVELDTPGGLDTSMREMIQRILSSSVPIACLVTPSGARAASAGTYLLYACHIAAMSPATNLGAAIPVSLAPSSSSAPNEPESQAPSNEQSMRNKVVNDAVAYIRGLAELRGRNGDWAELAVREGASVAANEALSLGVIDAVVNDRNDLMAYVHGQTHLGEELRLSNPHIEHITPGWRHGLLKALTNPNVALMLLMIGFYGLVFEFYSPGVGLPAILGGISLLLGLYALNLLPINIAGAALMLLGVVLMIAEAVVPSFGLFGVGGLVAFGLGAMLLMDTELPELQLAFPLVAAVATVSLMFMVVVIRLAIKSRQRPVVTGMNRLVGAEVRLEQHYWEQGLVELDGELWHAQSFEPIIGMSATVVRVDGLVLILANKEDTS